MNNYRNRLGTGNLFAQAHRTPLYRVELVCETLLDTPLVTTPHDAVRVLADYLRRKDREHFAVALLATSGRLIGVHVPHVGTLASCPVSTRDVFKAALLANAASVIVAHNHPSGNLEPSAADVDVSRKLAEAGRLMDVRVLDSLVVGHGGTFTSLAERGLL